MIDQQCVLLLFSISSIHYVMCSVYLMYYTTFNIKVGPLISHRHYSSTVRAEIHPAERLALTLRFLCTGNSQVWLIRHLHRSIQYV